MSCEQSSPPEIPPRIARSRGNRRISAFAERLAWRHHNPRMIVPTVDASRLPELLAGIPELHVMMLNTFRNPGAAIFDKLAKVDRIRIDIAMLELIEGLRVFLDQVPLDRIVFGSYMPYFYIEANLLKFAESNASEDQAKAIQSANARRILSTVA